MSQGSSALDKRLLAADVGNSVVHLGVFEDGELITETKVPTGEVTPQIVKDHLLNAGAIAVSSVVPSITPVFLRLANELGVSSLAVDHTLDLGVELDLEDPSQVGADRLCNVVAAHLIYGPPAIVIDFGTATTFDLLRVGGIYVGGLILPGALLQAAVLSHATAQLPLIDVRIPAHLFGRNTVEAIRAGVFYGSIGGVKFICEKLRNELGEFRLVLTGGGLAFFKKELGIEGSCDPHLTLKGLRLIYERNKN